MAEAAKKSVAPSADAEVSTAPLQGGGEEPAREFRPTGVDSEELVSKDDSKKELQDAAADRGLDESGTKQDLVTRITEHDEKGAHKPEVLYAEEED